MTAKRWRVINKHVWSLVTWTRKLLVPRQYRQLTSHAGIDNDVINSTALVTSWSMEPYICWSKAMASEHEESRNASKSWWRYKAARGDDMNNARSTN